MTATTRYEFPPSVCTQDPDRWTSTADSETRALCRACPRRWLCAKEACELPGVDGVWAGVVIPESGRARGYALAQLRSMAETHGYRVRNRKPELVST